MSQLLREERLRKQVTDLKRDLREALKTRVLEEDYVTFVQKAVGLKAEPPKWTVERAPGKAHQAIPTAHLSDLHADEVIRPAEVNFVNGYDRDIATRRLRLFFERAIMLCDDYLAGVHYPGIHLPISGDMFSGNIHDELKETNQDVLCSSLRYWIDQMYAGIAMFAERFGRVYVTCVVGNHPRDNKVPKAKQGVRSNFDWLLYSLLARDFERAKDKRVVFHVPDTFDMGFRIYGTRYLQTHGNKIKKLVIGGDKRKREREAAVRRPYDVTIMGDKHTRLCLPELKVNGSVKGYDEYAMSESFGFQEPMQSLWLTTPNHGITIEAPIHVKADNEGWERKAPKQVKGAIFGVAYKRKEVRNASGKK